MVASLYDSDFPLWAEKMAQLLREGRWEELDLENLIEEVEDLSKRERERLLSSLRVLLVHLLKWQYQPALRSASWEITIRRCRREIAEALEDAPSLKRFLTDPAWIEKTYRRARQDADEETGLGLEVFPVAIPFAVKQVLDPGFWPEEGSNSNPVLQNSPRRS